MLKIVRVLDGDDLDHIRELFLAYAAWTETDLSFQNFDEEMKNLPGGYAPPEGRLLLALHNGKPAGCIAVRKSEDGVCEMKRLYVSPDFQGAGIGKRLIDEIIAEAKLLGYRKMRLDTLPKMNSAQRLYYALGFKEIAPYRYNPVEGTVFMELDLYNL